jgi:hypothetical protein
LTDPEEISVVTNATAPEGWTIDDSLLNLGPLSARIKIPLGEGAIILPKLDVPRVVQTQASNEDGSLLSNVYRIAPAQGVLKIAHNLPPTLTSPDNNATGINTKTEFFWEGMPEHAVANLRIVTAAGSAFLPDLSRVHVRLAGTISGFWSVMAVGPAATVEEAMAIDNAYYAGTAVELFQTSGTAREFVTGD